MLLSMDCMDSVNCYFRQKTKYAISSSINCTVLSVIVLLKTSAYCLWEADSRMVALHVLPQRPPQLGKLMKS